MALRVRDAAGWFEIAISGDVDADEVREFVQLMGREARERGADKALVVIKPGTTVPGSLVRHKMGLLAAKTWPKNLRVAIVQTEGINHIFQATAQIRGLDIRVLDDLDEAEQWLEGKGS